MSELEQNIKQQNIEFKIFPDSSWLIAVIDDTDSHHKAALSSLGAIEPYKPIFYITPIVYLETMSRLIKKRKIAVKECYNKIQKFLSKIQYKHKSSLDLTEITQKFKAFSRIKISKGLSAIDFYVVTEGITLDAKILTCDLNMYYIAKKYYKNIYFLTDQVKDKGSDLGRLINDIQNI